MVTVLTPTLGRGAWPEAGIGGTLDLTGTRAGSYYRAPAMSPGMAMPGLVGALAVRTSGTCTMNHYAVYTAVKALQSAFGLSGAAVDGIFGRGTDLAARVYQGAHGLVVDGIIGPATSRSLFVPLVARTAADLTAGATLLGQQLVRGHIGTESQWDAGAVGYTTPDDLGLGQINAPSHPSMTRDECLTPKNAVAWVVFFVDGNLKSMDGNVRDAIAAYNLGVGGARSWVKAGRPDVWVHGVTTNVRVYIDRVLVAGEES